jgi:hypothetical protein
MAMPGFAKEWSAEQKEALTVLDSYLAAAHQGSASGIGERMRSFLHPKYIGWNYAQPLPMNKEAFLKEEEGFYKTNTLKKFEYKPLEIQIEGNLAIVHVNYDFIFGDPAGKEFRGSGPWTIIMVKQSQKWLVLSELWIAK